MELTQEEIKKLCEFVDDKNGFPSRLEISSPLVTDKEWMVFYEVNKHQILLECMSKLIKLGGINIEVYSKGFIICIGSLLGGKKILFEDYNNDFNLTLSKAILYCIGEME